MRQGWRIGVRKEEQRTRELYMRSLVTSLIDKSSYKGTEAPLHTSGAGVIVLEKADTKSYRLLNPAFRACRRSTTSDVRFWFLVRGLKS